MPECGQSLLRRNGKPQSCEPCRKSKIRCDHTLPICGRCVQRKIQYRCEYHPAPMSHQRETVGVGKRNHESPIRTVSSVGSEPSEWVGPTLHSHQPTPDAQKAAGDQATGFLGPTSFSAIFRENELGSSQDDFASHATNATFQEYHVADSSPPGQCNLEAQEHIDQGIRVLERLPDKALCDRLIARYFELCDVMIPEQVVLHVNETTWSTYKTSLCKSKRSRTVELSTMSKTLCKTAMTPLVASSSNRDWMDSFSSHNLRWEIVGNLFAIFGLAVMTMSDWDPLFASEDGNPFGKREYGGAMRECAEACLALCNDVDSVNDYVVCLMAATFSLQSIQEGDTSKNAP